MGLALDTFMSCYAISTGLNMTGTRENTSGDIPVKFLALYLRVSI